MFSQERAPGSSAPGGRERRPKAPAVRRTYRAAETACCRRLCCPGCVYSATKMQTIPPHIGAEPYRYIRREGASSRRRPCSSTQTSEENAAPAGAAAILRRFLPCWLLGIRKLQCATHSWSRWESRLETGGRRPWFSRCATIVRGGREARGVSSARVYHIHPDTVRAPFARSCARRQHMLPCQSACRQRQCNQNTQYPRFSRLRGLRSAVFCLEPNTHTHTPGILDSRFGTSTVCDSAYENLISCAADISCGMYAHIIDRVLQPQTCVAEDTETSSATALPSDDAQSDSRCYLPSTIK